MPLRDKRNVGNLYTPDNQELSGIQCDIENQLKENHWKTWMSQR